MGRCGIKDEGCGLSSHTCNACPLQILLHEDAVVTFSKNFAQELGAGLYVEYSSSDFVLSVLNTGCFIRYNTTSADLPPTQWVSMEGGVTSCPHGGCGGCVMGINQIFLLGGGESQCPPPYEILSMV